MNPIPRGGTNPYHVFADGIARLSYPIETAVLDPLVIQAQSLSTTNEGGKNVVSTVEAQILRSPSHQKYALYLFVDALCRAEGSRSALSRFPFTDSFALNLEKIFPHIYQEADDISKTKLIRLLHIWREKSRIFDPLLLLRIIARIDPEYHGEPLDSLPTPTLRSPAPYYHQATVLPQSIIPSDYINVYPPRPPTAPPTIIPSYFSPPPVISQPEALFARAAELLRQLQINVPIEQQLNLSQLHQAKPDLYQSLMDQAYRELSSPSAFLTQPPPNTTTKFQTTTGAPNLATQKFPTPPAIITARISTPPPVTSITTSISSHDLSSHHSLSLQDLTDKIVLSHDDIPFLVTALESAPFPPRKKNSLASDSTYVRSWFLSSSDWCSGKNSTLKFSVKIFPAMKNLEEESNDANLPSAMSESSESKEKKLQASISSASDITNYTELQQQQNSVPKDDSQKICPLTGDTFETFWSDEHQMWRYKNAIRPDPTGPIFKSDAWLAKQRGQNDTEQVRKRAKLE